MGVGEKSLQGKSISLALARKQNSEKSISHHTRNKMAPRCGLMNHSVLVAFTFLRHLYDRAHIGPSETINGPPPNSRVLRRSARGSSCFWSPSLSSWKQLSVEPQTTQARERSGQSTGSGPAVLGSRPMQQSGPWSQQELCGLGQTDETL